MKTIRKKILLIAVLFCFTATLATKAQSSTTQSRVITTEQWENSKLMKKTHPLYSKDPLTRMSYVKMLQMHQMVNERGKGAKTDYNIAMNMQDEALEKKSAAILAMDSLLREQAIESSRLAERHALEASNGLIEEMKSRQETEQKDLEEKQNIELANAQKSLEKAFSDYEKASSVAERMKERIKK